MSCRFKLMYVKHAHGESGVVPSLYLELPLYTDTASVEEKSDAFCLETRGKRP